MNLKSTFRHLIAITCFSTVSFATQVPHVSSEDAYASAVTNRAILVDVREKSEIIETGMAELAVWLPLSDIESRSNSYSEAIKNWPREQKVMFYCRSGRRSEIAAEHFAGQGFRSFNAGSFDDWKKAGLPVKPFEDR